MEVRGKSYRSVWMEGGTVCMIDQTLLPFAFNIVRCEDHHATCRAIQTMVTRGAGAIGAAAGFAMAQAALAGKEENYEERLVQARDLIASARPTARDLFASLEAVYQAALLSPAAALEKALALADQNAEAGRRIGQHGKHLIREGMGVLTHCNAGWLGLVDHGSALAPLYAAHREGRRFTVFADETRPRSQGARLTAWELEQEGIAHYIIPDNAAAWLMHQGRIGLVITGADRIAANGDTANKIGTLQKAIAAQHYHIPFYIAAPLSTFDPHCPGGDDIPIEARSEEEVHYQTGPDEEGVLRTVRVTSPGSPALNPAFDVTPHQLITGYITEEGIRTRW
ncbi:MAG TPA: S-methyl-5-thioribose-1-phosphate isomerase [Bacteroidales bacterium]|nr:S-methyl-5-thioribose-1-phosphate isomerase [Bacteroidales bacterium]